MKKVAFTQDLGVERATIEALLEIHKLKADWSLADGKLVNDPENVIAISTANIPLDSETLESFPNLKVVSMSFTGYDHVDKDYCLKNDISVYNVPAYSTDSVAELAIGIAISLLRQIPKGDKEIRNGNWNENITCFELAGKKCGIIGTGTIGCRLAELLSAFKCELVGFSRTEKEQFLNLGGTYTSLENLLQECDIVFITSALTEETRGLISESEIKLMKSSSYLVNVSRGPLVKREAILLASRNGLIAGIGLDVYDYEPLDKQDELRFIESSVLTPHVAYRTEEALKRKASITIDNIVNGIENKKLNRVI